MIISKPLDVGAIFEKIPQKNHDFSNLSPIFLGNFCDYPHQMASLHPIFR